MRVLIATRFKVVNTLKLIKSLKLVIVVSFNDLLNTFTI